METKICIDRIRSQLMLLLSGRQLPELLLRQAHEEPLQSHKRLEAILTIQYLPLGPAHKLLDLEQTRLVQVCSEAIIHFSQNTLQEARGILGFPRLCLNNLVHETGRHKLVTGNALAHNQGLVGLGNAEAFDECTACATLGDESERGERGEEEGVRSGINEVCVGDQGGGETDGRAIERNDQDLGVGVEGARDVDIV